MVDSGRFVVDASVAAKWHLSDEEYATAALALLAEYREGRVNLLAPDHIRYEVANAIRMAARARRLTVPQGRAAVQLFLSWGIPTTRSDALILAAYEASERFGCSLYDGLYLALAQAADCPVIYADKALRNLVKDAFPLAIWIGDYSPGGTGSE